VFYWLFKALLKPPLLTLARPTIEGTDNVPRKGGAIFASNHVSFADWLFLPLLVSRRITFLAKSDYFTERSVRGRAKAAFFRSAGQVPIDRSAADPALQTGLSILRSGNLLGIYPEGTRSPDGRLYRGRTGVARMALQAGVPVLPVAMLGTHAMAPPGKAVPRPARIRVRIGRPLDFARYEGLAEDRFVLRSITDEIMYAVMQMSGQEYVDVYASRAKSARSSKSGLDGVRDGAVDGEVSAHARDGALGGPPGPRACDERPAHRKVTHRKAS
jgi:1-acyl-sn-glycerol-3-phosphate acyltransferase